MALTPALFTFSVKKNFACQAERLMRTALLLSILLGPVTSIASELYSDDWVQGMARMEIGPSQSPVDLRQPILDVVPIGQTLKISQIFKRLNLDPKRVVSNGSEQRMNVTFYEWQISNSYLLSIMSGTSHVGLDPKKGQELQREGYGVRIIRIHASEP
jgi:hypothetical protein